MSFRHNPIINPGTFCERADKSLLFLNRQTKTPSPISFASGPPSDVQRSAEPKRWLKGTAKERHQRPWTFGIVSINMLEYDVFSHRPVAILCCAHHRLFSFSNCCIQLSQVTGLVPQDLVPVPISSMWAVYGKDLLRRLESRMNCVEGKGNHKRASAESFSESCESLMSSLGLDSRS